MDRYMELVQLTARGQGRMFFIDSGEGNEWNDPSGQWNVEDMCGWLVPLSEVDEFRLVWRRGREAVWASDKWTQYHCFVFWSKVTDAKPDQPPVTVTFKFYPIYPV